MKSARPTPFAARGLAAICAAVLLLALAPAAATADAPFLSIDPDPPLESTILLQDSPAVYLTETTVTNHASTGKDVIVTIDNNTEKDVAAPQTIAGGTSATFMQAFTTYPGSRVTVSCDGNIIIDRYARPIPPQDFGVSSANASPLAPAGSGYSPYGTVLMELEYTTVDAATGEVSTAIAGGIPTSASSYSFASQPIVPGTTAAARVYVETNTGERIAVSDDTISGNAAPAEALTITAPAAQQPGALTATYTSGSIAKVLWFDRDYAPHYPNPREAFAEGAACNVNQSGAYYAVGYGSNGAPLTPVASHTVAIDSIIAIAPATEGDASLTVELPTPLPGGLTELDCDITIDGASFTGALAAGRNTVALPGGFALLPGSEITVSCTGYTPATTYAAPKEPVVVSDFEPGLTGDWTVDWCVQPGGPGYSATGADCYVQMQYTTVGATGVAVELSVDYLYGLLSPGLLPNRLQPGSEVRLRAFAKRGGVEVSSSEWATATVLAEEFTSLTSSLGGGIAKPGQQVTLRAGWAANASHALNITQCKWYAADPYVHGDTGANAPLAATDEAGGSTLTVTGAGTWYAVGYNASGLPATRAEPITVEYEQPYFEPIVEGDQYLYYWSDIDGQVSLQTLITGHQITVEKGRNQIDLAAIPVTTVNFADTRPGRDYRMSGAYVFVLPKPPKALGTPKAGDTGLPLQAGGSYTALGTALELRAEYQTPAVSGTGGAAQSAAERVDAATGLATLATGPLLPGSTVEIYAYTNTGGYDVPSERVTLPVATPALSVEAGSGAVAPGESVAFTPVYTDTDIDEILWFTTETYERAEAVAATPTLAVDNAGTWYAVGYNAAGHPVTLPAAVTVAAQAAIAASTEGDTELTVTLLPGQGGSYTPEIDGNALPAVTLSEGQNTLPIPADALLPGSTVLLRDAGGAQAATATARPKPAVVQPFFSDDTAIALRPGGSPVDASGAPLEFAYSVNGGPLQDGQFNGQNAVEVPLPSGTEITRFEAYSHVAGTGLYSDATQAVPTTPGPGAPSQNTTPLAVKGLPTTIRVGDTFTLTPEESDTRGGSDGWTWDTEYFSASFNSPATFTALKAGATTIVFESATGRRLELSVTILPKAGGAGGPSGSAAPTGDATSSWLFVALALAAAGLLCTLLLVKKKRIQ